MKSHVSLSQPGAPATKFPAGQGNAASAAPKGFWPRLAARVSSWFEIPYGYQDETGFHYGHQPPPIFTDRAEDAMTYPMALPQLTSPFPDPSPPLPEPAASVAKD